MSSSVTKESQTKVIGNYEVGVSLGENRKWNEFKYNMNRNRAEYTSHRPSQIVLR